MKQSKYFGPKVVGPKAYLTIASSKLCNFLDVKTLSGRDRAFVGEPVLVSVECEQAGREELRWCPNLW